MNRMLKNRGISDLLNMIAFIVGIVGLICYLVSAEDKSAMTETVVSAMVYAPMIIALVINVVAVFIRNSLVKIVAFAAYFFAVASWFYTQGGYIVNVLMGIDGNVFSFAYILTIICLLACTVLSIVAAALTKKKRRVEVE